MPRVTIRTDVEVERALDRLTRTGRSRAEVVRTAILGAERQDRRLQLRTEAEALGSDPADVAASRELAAEMEALSTW